VSFGEKIMKKRKKGENEREKGRKNDLEKWKIERPNIF
jgi:hypothetical protein